MTVRLKSFVKRPIVGLLLALTVLSPTCKKAEVKKPMERVVNVRVQTAEKRALKPFVDAIGTLTPCEEVIVSAEVEGVLREVRVDEGTVVSRGMVLAAIDDTDYRLEVRRSEAALKQAEATRENTKLEFGRKQALFKEELVTRQQFDDAATRLSLAEADLDRARAALDIAREKLRRTRIASPLAGVVKEKKVSAGDFVKNGTNLCVVIQNNPLKMNFTVPEREMDKLKLGRDVSFRVDAFPEKDFKGKVSIVYPALQEQTRSLQVEAQVPNPEGLLKPGLFTHVTLYTGEERDTILVPVISLLYEGEKVKLFVVENGKAKERAVTTGNKYGEMVEIISGLSAGEQVVFVGHQNISEGVKVNVAR